MNDITKIMESHVKGEGDFEVWPYPTVIITSRITGKLREKILTLTGTIAEKEVLLEETTISVGYSEYTADYEYEIRVLVDGNEVWSHDMAYSPETAMAAFLRWVK